MRGVGVFGTKTGEEKPRLHKMMVTEIEYCVGVDKIILIHLIDGKDIEAELPLVLFQQLIADVSRFNKNSLLLN